MFFLNGNIKRFIKLHLNRTNWKKKNSHNFTNVVNIFPLSKVLVGKNSYGPLKVTSYGHPNEKLIIGNYCSISEEVEFLLGGEHHPEFLLNFPLKQYTQPGNDIDDRRTKGPIILGDDVWIGRGALILSGVKIGQGAIIAAGSIVTKDVPPYAIYTTNRIIKYRFPHDIIEKLMELDFSKLDLNFSKENIDLFYSSNIENVLSDPKIKSIMKHKGENKIE